MSRLTRFVRENYGVLVTSQTEGFVCQSCGAKALFASKIQHAPDCVLTESR